MRSTLTRIALAAGLVAGTATFAPAQENTPAQGAPTQEDGVERRGDPSGRRVGGEGRRGRMGRGRRHRMALRGLRRQLDLTDAQKEQLRALRQTQREANEDERAELRGLRRLRRQGGTLTPEQQIRAQALREHFRASGESRRQQFLSLLTPEQRARLEQHRSEMKERREQFRQRREEFRQRRTQQTPQQ